MSNTEKKGKIPDAPVPAAPSGNLLSSVAPPIELPNFVKTSNVPNSTPAAPQVMPQPPQVSQNVQSSPQSSENFSPVIPLSKGEPTLPIRSPEDSQTTTHSPVSLPASSPGVDALGDPMPGSGLLTWMKGAVSSGGLLHRVAEKAKSSVDSMITTLDPQMKEYLNSGGDILIVVASDNDDKISPVREAFQAVFGKATIIGYPVASDGAAQAVGYAAACAAAARRIARLRAARPALPALPALPDDVPVLAIENYLYEAVDDRWFEASVLVLAQPSRGIELQLASQAAGVPGAAAAAARAATPAAYAHAAAGFAVTVAEIMAANLQVHETQWQEAATGVSRREILTLAARSLAGSYKNLLAISAAEP